MRRLGTLIACATLVFSAAPAQAKKKKKKSAALGPVVTVAAQGNNTTTQGQRSNAIAVCPPPTVAVGGGFSAPFTGGAAAIVVDNSYRSSSDSWQASGENIAGTGAVTAYAYCRGNVGPVTDTTGSAALAGTLFATGTATASCPSGTQLISGGFQTTRGPTPTAIAFAFVNLQTAPGTWTVSSANNTNNPQTVTAHAYCTSGINPPAAVTGSAAAAVPTFGSVSASSAACPTPKKPKKKGKKTLAAKKKKGKRPRQVLTAGGYSGGAPTAGGPFSIFTDSRAGAGVWLATAINGTPFSGSFLVTSQAICV